MDVLHRLQSILQSLKIQSLELPAIVCVGGKTSLIEQIVGRDFLPKGGGIVTRRPLILQLHHSDSELCTFAHNDKSYSYEEVKAEIEVETQRVAGLSKLVDPTPIQLQIYSPRVMDLVLVDLPGLTKIPVGDQPQDIDFQIRNMVLTYISNPNSIILAISAANVDLANSDALKLAREVDPQGLRTLGILSKVDLVDSENLVLDILMNNVYPLHYGFVPVINRSQKDISMQRTIEYAREIENRFFSSPVYSQLMGKCGSLYLQKQLNQILLMKIKQKLPEIKSVIRNLLIQKQNELQNLGEKTESPDAMVLNLLTKYSLFFTQAVDGTRFLTMELSGGARIYDIFENNFLQSIQNIECELTADEIKIAIRNSNGPRPSLFLPEAAFDCLVRPEIKKLLPHALKCVELVYETLVLMTHKCVDAELLRFPKLHDHILNSTKVLIKENLSPTQKFIQNLVDIQCAYINTNHPDFVGGPNAVARLERKYEKDSFKRASIERMKRMTLPDQGLTSSKERLMTYFFKAQEEQMEVEEPPRENKEEFCIELIRTLISSYFSISRRVIADTVPKAIMNFLVNSTKESLQSRLVRELYRDDLVPKLLEEDPEISNARDNCVKLINIFNQALDAIAHVSCE